MKDVIFNKDEMREFITHFNPTEKKYDISTASKNYFEAVKYDNFCRPLNLKKSKVKDMIKSTNIVYGNLQQSIDYGLIYQNVLDKFLLNFVCIPQLASLYDTQYMDFEWNMHSNLDFEKYTNSYYRDHFIHQVRNMFMVLQLIDDEYIYHNIKHALTSSTRSKVTQYFNVQLNEWLNTLENNNKLGKLLERISKEKIKGGNLKKLKELLEKIAKGRIVEEDYKVLKEVFEKIAKGKMEEEDCKELKEFIEKTVKGKIEKEDYKEIEELLQKIVKEKIEEDQKNKYYKDYFSNYVIRASLIIACLFHDIGYPVAHYLSVKERLINFIPAVYSVMGDNNFDFNYIYSVLSETVLFQFVGKEEIQEKFNQNDHGTISAILVGIFFYKTGLIHSLSGEKQTAVELGMLAIYNHTLDLKFCKPEAKTDYIKMRFMLNPISYMLRWCDDMQEWDREYFEIAPVSNLVFCSVCKRPLKKERMLPHEYLERNNIVLKEESIKEELDRNTDWFRSFFGYRCACKENDEYNFTKREDFNRRTLIQIKACEEVTVEKDDDYENGKITINFKYNPYKLLRLSRINPSFFKVRQKEMVALKKFVEGQSFFKGKKGYWYICINHNLSLNPMLLKMFGLREFLESANIILNGFSEREQNIDEYLSNSDILREIDKGYNQLISLLENEKVYSEYENIIIQLANHVLELCYGNSIPAPTCYEVSRSNCRRYIALMVCQDILVRQNNEKDRKTVLDSFKSIFGGFHDGDIRKELIDAAFKRIEKTPNFDEPSKIIGSDDYNEYLKESEYIFTVVSDYCDFENEINDIKSVDEELTYYTDLYLFKQLNNLTEMFKKLKKEKFREEDR